MKVWKAAGSAVILLLLIGSLVLACQANRSSEVLILGEGSGNGGLADSTPPTSTIGVGSWTVAGQESSARRAGLTELPLEMPQDFQFGLIFGVNAASMLEVQPRAGRSDYEGMFLRDRSVGGATVRVTFSREEVLNVYARLRDMLFLQYPQEFAPPGVGPSPSTATATSAQSYGLVIEFNGVEHGVFWLDAGLSQGADAVTLRHLLTHVQKLLEAKLEAEPD